ncbi:MAG: WcbI family polysaccharide biosynthesis putative acetyltransferase [Pseudomonadota bacterium]
MKKLVILANCQGGALAEMLFESQEFASCYELHRIPAVQSLTDGDVGNVVAKVSDADLFIYQPVKEAPGRRKEFSSDFLLGLLKPGALAISFPSLYFDGYFPHLGSLRGLVSVLNRVHDYFIAYACALGLSEAACIDLIRSEELYSKELSVELLERSLNNLKEREAADKIDVTVSGYIEEGYRSRKMFYQFNHPDRGVFVYVASRILEKIGFDSGALKEGGSSYLDAISAPLYSSTHKNLGLRFENDPCTYSALGDRQLGLEQVVSEFYAFYKAQDLAVIKQQVLHAKPFVGEIVHRYLNGGFSAETADLGATNVGLPQFASELKKTGNLSASLAQDDVEATLRAAFSYLQHLLRSCPVGRSVQVAGLGRFHVREGRAGVGGARVVFVPAKAAVVSRKDGGDGR